MGDIQLEYVVPSADCARYVTLFYWFRADLPRFEETERADHAQLRFRLSPAAAEYHFADGTTVAAPPIHLLGPTTAATRVFSEGPIEVFGCGITPEGWAALLGPTAAKLRDRVADPVRLFGAPVTLAASALVGAPDIVAMVAIVERLILTLARHSGEDLAAFVAKVDRWLAAAPSPEIDDLIAATSLSRRQLERKCQALYGAPPKLLARKYRALRTAVAMVSHRLTAADVVDRGFYDQSHMIREVKRFTGLTPGQIAAQPNALAQLTISQRSAFGDTIRPLISDT